VQTSPISPVSFAVSSANALTSDATIAKPAIDADADPPPILIAGYRIAPERREAFLVYIRDLKQQRRRDGAYSWDVFEHA
jgi:hypothetical protein